MLRRTWRLLNGTLIGQVVGTLVVTLLLGAGATIWQARTGQPAALLHRVPVNVWWTLVGGVIMAMLIALVLAVRRTMVNRNYGRADPVVAVARHPIFGSHEMEFEYAGMSWRLVVSLPPSWHRTGVLGFNPSDARVDGRPRCPKCGTGLEEHPTVFGRYRVRCVDLGCDFSIRQRDSFAALRPRAELVGQRQLEVAAEQRRRQATN